MLRNLGNYRSCARHGYRDRQMKNLLVSLLLFFVAVSSYSQTKHLTIMGIPITGNIATFQQKLAAKSYRVDAVANKDLPVGQRALRGNFQVMIAL